MALKWDRVDMGSMCTAGGIPIEGLQGRVAPGAAGQGRVQLLGQHQGS